ncbi:hypothetical protein AMECASPLE_017208 [Ameca splendens]|uniref:NR LBD domain-containing protein n=1 Tax=Ameca splendens TaxID=208324 RepID=A0ABV0Z0Q2_9TELE
MEIFDMLLAATSRFRELKLQREEYVCLKAMILLNSNLCTNSPQTAEELESRNKLLRLLDSVIDALVWAISKLGLSTQQQTLRLGHLTMLLSHIRHVRYTHLTGHGEESIHVSVRMPSHTGPYHWARQKKNMLVCPFKWSRHTAALCVRACVCMCVLMYSQHYEDQN